MVEKLGEFFEKYAGIIIGALIGFILVVSKMTVFIINILIIVMFAYLGKYIQNNGANVKEKIKKIIEKW